MLRDGTTPFPANMAEPPPSLDASNQGVSVIQQQSPSSGSNPVMGGDYGGYDYDFVTSPDDRYKCSICTLVMREPCQTPCGHLYCRRCIVIWIRKSQSGINRCPVDNEEISENGLFLDNFARREVDNFQAYCPNTKEGCDVIATVKHMPAHLKMCLFALVPCPNKCSYVLRKKDLEEHVQCLCERRIKVCLQCGSIDSEAHEDVCQAVQIQCRYCREEVKRSEMSNHEDQLCPNKIILCTFHHLGCHEKMARGELENHLKEKITVHLNLLCWGVMVIYKHLNLPPLSFLTNGHPPPAADMTQAEMMDAMAGLLPSLRAASLTVPENGPEASEPSSSFTPPSSHHAAAPSSPSPFSIPAFSSAQHHLRSLFRHTTSPPNSTHPRSLPNYPHAYRYHHHVSPTASDVQHHSRDLAAALSLAGEAQDMGTMTYHSEPAKDGTNQDLSPVTMAHRSGTEYESSSLSLQSSLASSSLYVPGGVFGDKKNLGGSSFCSNEGSSWQSEPKLIAHEQELVMLQGKVDSVERRLKSSTQQLTELEGRLCQGLFYWRIRHYSRYQQEAERGLVTALHSPPFYTRPTGGYRLCLRANLHGVESARGNHLSLFVHFMQGEDDDVLDWPFAGKIDLSVVDQNPCCELRKTVQETLVAQPSLAAFQRPSSPRNHKGFGYMEFLPLSALKNSTYVLNDTLIIRAYVQPLS